MKKIIYVAITFSVIFMSCKKDDVDPVVPTNTTTTNTITTIVPMGPITRTNLFQENGSMSGVVEGVTNSGIPFSKSFTHELDGAMGTYYLNPNGDYNFYIKKLDKIGGIDGTDKKSEISFTLRGDRVSLKSIENFQVFVYVDSSATGITKFNINANASNGFGPNTFSNVVFNVADGTFSCDYNITVLNPATTSGRQARVTGKISTRLTNIRYRTGS